MNNAATNLIEQIGSGAFAMLGAKDLVDTGNGLMFAIRGSKKCNKIVIELTHGDEYRVQFWKIRGLKMSMVSDVRDVQVSQLRRVIEENTGLRVSL